MTQPHANQEAAVRALQTYLQQLAYLDRTIPYVPVNGRFDDTTRRALTEFQRANRLPATGVADRPTWERLYAAYVQAKARNAIPTPIVPFPPFAQTYAVSLGEESDLVAILRYMLNALSVDYAELGPLADGKYFDRDLEAAVRNFQSVNALPADGRVDLATWNRLAHEYNRLAHIGK